MIKDLKVVVLIPGRGNSKGINRKNLLKYKGFTLIENAILNAKESAFVDEIYVNSDDIEILEIARKYNVCIYKRDPILSRDDATANDVLVDFVNHFKYEKDYFIIYLQPTSPLRTTNHINSICELLEKSVENCAVSVTQIDSRILKSFFIRKGKIVPISDELFINKNRQDLPSVYESNGALYIFLKSDFMLAEKIPLHNAVPFVMDTADSIDIDSLEDYENLLRREIDEQL